MSDDDLTPYEEIFVEITSRQFSQIMDHLMQIVLIMQELVQDYDPPIPLHLVKKPDPDQDH